MIDLAIAVIAWLALAGLIVLFLPVLFGRGGGGGYSGGHVDDGPPPPVSKTPEHE